MLSFSTMNVLVEDSNADEPERHNTDIVFLYRLVTSELLQPSVPKVMLTGTMSASDQRKAVGA